MNIHAGLGVAVREFPLKWKEGAEIKSGSADYLLYADRWAVGVIEAKPAGHTLEGVVVQSKRYTEGLDERVPARYRPLPFAYESTGEVTQFTNGLDPHPRSREVFTFHRPDELLRQQELGSAQLRRLLQKMPGLPQGKLWPVQHEAICHLEQSLAHGRPRALIQMATGSGKTFMAVSACHRLIKHANAKRILFLVDRNNLGRQTLNEFQQFRDPASPLHLRRRVPGSAPAGQRHRTGRQGGHHDYPASLLDPEGRSRVRSRQRGRVALRVRSPARQRACPGRIHSGRPGGGVRLHRDRRMPPLDLQRLAAGDRVFRRLPDRPDRDPESPHHRVLRQQRRAGLFAHEGRGGRSQRRLRHLSHQDEDLGGRRKCAGGALRAEARPAHPQEDAGGAGGRPHLHRNPARPRRGRPRPDPARGEHLPGTPLHGDLPGAHRSPQDARLRQNGQPRRRHHEHHQRGVRQGQRLLPEDHVEDDWRLARGPAEQLP